MPDFENEVFCIVVVAIYIHLFFYMKVAYISYPAFADCDVPLLHSLQNKVDITYILCVSKGSCNQTLLNISRNDVKSGIHPAGTTKGLEQIGAYFDINKVYICWESTNNRLGLFQNCLKLCFFLKKCKFDIVHITWPLSYTSFPLYIFKGKMILTVHDPLPHSSNINRMSQMYRKVAFKLVGSFIILNKTQKEDFIQTYNLYKKKIFTSRLSIYYHLSNVDAKRSDRKDYVLFFGQISAYKGLDVLCESMRLVRRIIPSAKLLVAGRGDIYFNINEYVDDGTIDFFNYYIPNEELAGLIKNASFVVCPYLDATQSGVIMSSFSLNIPVVVTSVGGLPEMVGYGKYGMVIPPEDPRVVSESIVHLLKNPNLLKEYKDNIQNDFFKGEKSWDNIAEEIGSIYNQCCNAQ